MCAHVPCVHVYVCVHVRVRVRVPCVYMYTCARGCACVRERRESGVGARDAGCCPARPLRQECLSLEHQTRAGPESWAHVCGAHKRERLRSAPRASDFLTERPPRRVRRPVRCASWGRSPRWASARARPLLRRLHELLPVRTLGEPAPGEQGGQRHLGRVLPTHVPGLAVRVRGDGRGQERRRR